MALLASCVRVVLKVVAVEIDALQFAKMPLIVLTEVP